MYVAVAEEPLSRDAPTKTEHAATAHLETLLRDRYGVFEPVEAIRAREIALAHLARVVDAFVARVSRRRGFPETGGRLFAFGSFRLGVHEPGSDVDTLVVAPRQVSRDDFFADFADMLRARPELTSLAPVRDAFVPVMKIVFCGVDMDLLFARVDRAQVPPDLDLSDDAVLAGQDEVGVRALNGARVTDAVLRLVPDRVQFRLALRAVRLWARRRGVYSNVLGYPGGVAWAILVARVCQLYPTAVASTLVAKFFRFCRNWDWNTAVQLAGGAHGDSAARVSLPPGVRPWGHDARDRFQPLKVLTPAFPCINSTYNVTRSAFCVLAEEFARGYDVMERVCAVGESWAPLFEPSDFFYRYPSYLQITALARDSLDVWAGWVQSRLRALVKALETVDGLRRVHPHPAAVDIEGARCFFVGLVADARRCDLTPRVAEFARLAGGWAGREAHMDLRAAVVARKNLPACVRDPEVKREKRKPAAARPTAPAAAATTCAETAAPPRVPHAAESAIGEDTPAAPDTEAVSLPIALKRRRSQMAC